MPVVRSVNKEESDLKMKILWNVRASEPGLRPLEMKTFDLAHDACQSRILQSQGRMEAQSCQTVWTECHISVTNILAAAYGT